jgi:hypothetical protein
MLGETYVQETLLNATGLRPVPQLACATLMP